MSYTLDGVTRLRNAFTGVLLGRWEQRAVASDEYYSQCIDTLGVLQRCIHGDHGSFG